MTMPVERTRALR